MGPDGKIDYLKFDLAHKEHSSKLKLLHNIRDVGESVVSQSAG